LIRQRVIAAREIQVQWFSGRKEMSSNADMQSKEILRYRNPDTAGEELLKMAIAKHGFPTRAYDRILNVGRTIADRTGSAGIKPEHISEAIQRRILDRNLSTNI